VEKPATRTPPAAQPSTSAPPPAARPPGPPTPAPPPRPAAGAKQPALKPAPAAAPPPKPAAAAPGGTKAAPEPAKPPPTAATAPAGPSPLDLNSLTAQLRSTSAIGFFTKITLKNQVDDLLDDLREFHGGKSRLTKPELRRAYDLLLMKVLSLLQDKDPKLASAIVSSREAIWDLLTDPKRFATVAT
jgi:hypothetical protein